MYSWRTRLLPYLELRTLHDRYDFQQPWDAPENQAVAKMSIEEFRCPSVPDSPERPKNRTDYVAVTGDDTLWPTDGTSRSLKDVTVGTDYAAMLIEMNNSDIPWSEPRDVKLEDLLSGKVSWSKTGVHTSRGAFYYPVPGRNVLFADGHICYIYGDLTSDQIRRLFSITEPFDVDAETQCPEARPIVYRHVVFYIWLATLLLQFVYIFFPVEKRAGEA